MKNTECNVKKDTNHYFGGANNVLNWVCCSYDNPSEVSLGLKDVSHNLIALLQDAGTILNPACIKAEETLLLSLLLYEYETGNEFTTPLQNILYRLNETVYHPNNKDVNIGEVMTGYAKLAPDALSVREYDTVAKMFSQAEQEQMQLSLINILTKICAKTELV